MSWNQFFLHRGDDAGIALAVDEEQKSDLPVDFRDVAFEDELGEDGPHKGFPRNIFLDLAQGRPDPEFDDVEMPRVVLAGAGSGQIEVGEVAEDPFLFEPLAFAAHRAYIHAG